MRIRGMLEKGMSLDEIAEKLNHKGVRAPHGRGKWSAARYGKRLSREKGVKVVPGSEIY
jgi:hypothetical protein